MCGETSAILDDLRRHQDVTAYVLRVDLALGRLVVAPHLVST